MTIMLVSLGYVNAAWITTLTNIWLFCGINYIFDLWLVILCYSLHHGWLSNNIMACYSLVLITLWLIIL